MSLRFAQRLQRRKAVERQYNPGAVPSPAGHLHVSAVLLPDVLPVRHHAVKHLPLGQGTLSVSNGREAEQRNYCGQNFSRHDDRHRSRQRRWRRGGRAGRRTGQLSTHLIKVQPFLGQTAASRTETGARRVWLKNASCTHAVAARAPPSLFFPHGQFIAVRDVRNHQKPGSSQAAPETLYKSAQFALGISGRCHELRERYDPPVPLVQRRE